MKLSDIIKTPIVLAAVTISLPAFAADLDSNFNKFLYGNNELNSVKTKEVSLFHKTKDKKTIKKNTISVEHVQKEIENDDLLTDEDYIKSLKQADKKKIRKKQFQLNVINEEPENVDIESSKKEEISTEDYDAIVKDPTNKSFFSKNKKKNQKKTQKDEQKATSTDITLTADETFYNPEKNEIEAIGNVKFEISGQDVTLYGDKIIFSYATNSVRAYKNVKIIKGDNVTTGDFINIDLSTACGWIQNPVTFNYSVSIKAKDAYVYSEKIEENEGVAKILEDKRIISDSSGMVSTLYSTNSVNIADVFVQKPEPSPMKFKVKEITVIPKDKHNDIILKGVSVYYKKLKIANIPLIEIASDSNNTAMQTNIPEIGGDNIVGMYVGPAWTFDLPCSSTLKIAPLAVYNSDASRFGVGGAATFMNRYNTTQIAYGSPKEKFVLNGIQKITDHLSLKYSQESYTDEWFMGARRPRYALTLQYADKYYIDDLQTNFSHIFNIGAYTDDGNSSIRTNGQGRARWLGQLDRQFYTYTNNANTFTASVGLIGQAAISQYSKGDTFTVFRIAPTLNTTYRFWTQNISYFQSKANGRTPFKFDDYFYGESNLTFMESIRLHKYLSIGYIGSLSLGGRKSHYTGGVNNDIDKLFQESRFIVSIGPDEAKLTLGYDIYRQTTSLYYTMMLGSKDMEINFNKAVLNNPDKINTSNEENQFFEKMKNIKYKIFPATNPNFNRKTDLYPTQIPANGDENQSDIIENQEQIQLEEQIKNNFKPFLNEQNLMKNDRM